MLSVALRQRVADWLDYLDETLIERGVEARLVVLGILSKHHVLLLGPPGTAKSLLASEATAMTGGPFFQTLLTRFSTPEDVFGPLSLKDLEEGRYRRLTAGYLPASSVAFVDEIFKANASILNSLLSILNERVFFQGEEKQTLLLRAVVAASNEGADEDAGLDALDDRLLLRVAVEPLSPPGLKRLLDRAPRRRTVPKPLAPAELAEIDSAAKAVKVTDDCVEALVGIRESARKAGVQISDRRMRHVVDVVCTMAALDGDAEVNVDVLGVLAHALWRAPDDRAKVDEAMKRALGAGDDDELVARLNERINALAEIEKTARRGYGIPPPDEEVTKAVETMKLVGERLAAPQLSARERTLWGPLIVSARHTEAQRAQLSALRDRLADHSVFTALSEKGYSSLAKNWWQRFPSRV